MTLKIKNITTRNFLSTGNITQSVNLDSDTLTLILGENLDLGGGASKNGCGKSALIQAVSYALYGASLNGIKKDDLINHTNNKNMMVSLDFESNGKEYRIERGRKPAVLRLYVDGKMNEADDQSQGDSRETQDMIERILNMSHDMFKQVVALNTYNEPFLAMKAGDQRTVIEQLLGVTILSEKAEAIKELMKDNRSKIQSEEFRINALLEANKRVTTQIDSLKLRQTAWSRKKNEDLAGLVAEYTRLESIDFDQELKNHDLLSEYTAQTNKNAQFESVVVKHTAWDTKHAYELTSIEQKIKTLSSIDIDVELNAHTDLVTYNEGVVKNREINSKISQHTAELIRNTNLLPKLKTEIESLEQHKCHACGQEVHDDNHSTILNSKLSQLSEVEASLTISQQAITDLTTTIVDVGTKPTPHNALQSQAMKHEAELNALSTSLLDKMSECNPYDEEMMRLAEEFKDLGVKPVTLYSTVTEASKWLNTKQNLVTQMEQKHNEADPYADQISEMCAAMLQTVNYDEVNRLTSIVDHQKFLVDLLTNKDSFVRKKIIDQNLVFLNGRLAFYLDKLGLPHTVKFQNDLSVEISELGREISYGNLSRGESSRVILALSMSFRDVFEGLYQPINVLFVDEILDSGMDMIGTDNAINMFKDMSINRNKSIWVVSHKDEVVIKVPSILKVVKSNGFTTYHTDSTM